MSKASQISLIAMVALFACRPAPVSEPFAEVVFSTKPTPAPADILMGCETQEAISYRSLLVLLPPWDQEYPKSMLDLGFTLEETKETRCLQAAEAMFLELALAYPNRKEALRATLEVGALSLYLKEPSAQLDRVLAPYADRGARLLEAAKT